MPAAKKSSAWTPAIGDASVQKATGQPWSTWLTRLDAAGARDLPHREIAALLRADYQLPAWWAQMVTVGYEQAIGRRIVGQACNGKFNATASKTLPVSAAVAHRWFADARQRTRWLAPKIILRKSTAPKSIRLGFPDGSIAGIAFTAKGSATCLVGVSHDGFATAAAAKRQKDFWREALLRLAGKISA